MVFSASFRRWSSSNIIFLRWVTGTPPVTHTYIKPSSNQRSTTSRVASAAERLRSNGDLGNGGSSALHYFKQPHCLMLPTVARIGHYTGVQRTSKGF